MANNKPVANASIKAKEQVKHRPKVGSYQWTVQQQKYVIIKKQAMKQDAKQHSKSQRHHKPHFRDRTFHPKSGQNKAFTPSDI